MTTQNPPVITLTTDFGTGDSYVAQMKGVILSIAPGAAIHDLTHQIGVREIDEAAAFLADAAPFFPSRTIHVGVVDPGVGTNRAAIVVACRDQVFVGPDNGLFAAAINAMDPDRESTTIWTIENSKVMNKSVSSTFHGRDIFAPVAARIAMGMYPGTVGASREEIVEREMPKPMIFDGGKMISGVLVRADRFGNLETNIPRTMIGPGNNHDISLEWCKTTLRGITEVFGLAPAGQLLGYVNSQGMLAIGKSMGSALEHFSLQSNRVFGHGVKVQLRR